MSLLSNSYIALLKQNIEISHLGHSEESDFLLQQALVIFAGPKWDSVIQSEALSRILNMIGQKKRIARKKNR